jgi:hypothetical protein
MDLVPTDKELPSVDKLSDESLINIWKHSDKVEKYISAVRSHIIHRFSEGKPLDGLKIIAGVAKRRWRDEEITKDTLRAAGIDPIVENVVNLGTAERKLKEAGLKKTQVDAIMYTLTEKPLPPPKIALLEDKRPAIDIVAKDLLFGLDEIELGAEETI